MDGKWQLLFNKSRLLPKIFRQIIEIIWFYFFSILKSNYDPAFLDTVYKKSTEYTYADYLKDSNSLKDKSILITYQDKPEFLTYAKYFGIMDDFKVSSRLN